MEEKSDLQLSYLTGNFHECSPVFVHSADLVLFAAGSVINMVSSTTGNIVGVFREHHHLVTAIALLGDQEEVVHSSSVDGVIFEWNLKTLAVLTKRTLNSPVFDIVSTGRAANELTLVTGFGSKHKHNSDKKRFSVVQYNTDELKICRKLSSLQFPRRCTAVLRIPRTQILAATGEALSFNAIGDNGNETAETVLVVASSRKVSFIAMSGLTEDNGNSVASMEIPVIHIIPDPENRRGAITCIAVGSQDDGILITGHEKGNIVVWHNIIQFYLAALVRALAQAQRTAANNNGATATTTVVSEKNSKKSKKDKKEHKKKHNVLEFTVTTLPLCTTMHWHSHAVHCLSLTADGVTLYSGGSEGVLVVWHNVNTSISTGGSKSFIPRLGCPISFLTNNSSALAFSGISVAVTTTDNCIHVINTASMREEWTVRSLCITSRQVSVPKRKDLKQLTVDEAAEAVAAAEQENDQNEHQFLGINRAAASRTQAHTLPFLQSDYYWRTTLAVEPRTQWLVCNGYPGQLQAFDCRSQSLCHSYQVVDFTRVSKKEANSKMYVPSISHSQFLTHSSMGSFMATVDVRKGVELEAENSLKFWEWSDVSAKYRLGAQMDNPHGPVRITALSFAGAGSNGAMLQRNAVMCATASVDGTVKVWRAERSEIAPQPTLSTTAKRQATHGTRVSADDEASVRPIKWTCSYSFKYRDTSATSVCFSRDGSLLAVTHRNLLSLWDPLTVQLKASIVVPVSNNEITNNNSSSSSNILYSAFIEPRADASLGGGCGKAYIFLASQNCISVYDLLTLELVWSQSAKKFTAFAVASSEDLLPTSHADAWIAVAVEEEEQAAEDRRSLQQHKVLMFSPFSGTPVVSHPLPARASAMVYTPDNEASRRGLAVATETCEMLYLSVSAGAQTDNGEIRQLAGTVGSKSATVYKVSLPTLTAGAEQVIREAGSDLHNHTSAVSAFSSKPGWLKDYFDEHSENIPSLSALSAGFFSNFRSAPSVAPTSASATAAATVASVAAAASKLNKKRSIAEVSSSSTSSAATSTVTQQQWDEALIPFFSGVSVPKIVTPAVASTPVSSPTGSVKNKKSAKKGGAAEVIEPVVEAVIEPVVEMEVVKDTKKSKKASKIPLPVAASTLQTIAEDQEMVIEEGDDTAAAVETAETDPKRRRTARSSSISSVASVNSTESAPRGTRAGAAASKIPAKAPRVAASPSVVVTAAASAPPSTAVATKVTASKLALPTAGKRVLPAAASAKATKAAKNDIDSSDSESSAGLRRSTRARSNSTMSEDSTASVNSATRRSTRSSQH